MLKMKYKNIIETFEIYSKMIVGFIIFIILFIISIPIYLVVHCLFGYDIVDFEKRYDE